MKTKIRFGVALIGVVASGAMFLCQQPFASAQDADLDDEASLEDAVASEEPLFLRPPQVKLSDLAGSWAISLGGNTGCGLSTLYVTVDLDARGTGTARIIGSSTGCPPGDDPAEPFQILTLNADGSGTAGLSCGPGCGWSFIIQVPRNDPNSFTLVDVQDPNNVLVGSAARKW